MPPMVPMLFLPACIYQRIGCCPPLSGRCLPCQDEPSHARPGKLLDPRRQVLATAVLWVDHSTSINVGANGTPSLEEGVR